MKKHGWTLLGCFGIALLVVLYYQITQFGMGIFNKESALWVLILTAGFFALAEGWALLCRKVLEPKLSKRAAKDGKKPRLTARNLTALALCLVFAVISFLPVIMDFVHRSYPYFVKAQAVLSVGGGDGTTGPVTRDTEISQSFVCTSDSMKALVLQTGSCGEEKDSTLEITLLDGETWAMAGSWSLPAGDIAENSSLRLEIAEGALEGNVNGKRFVLSIASDATSRNAVTLRRSIVDSYPDGTLSVNGEPEEGDLALSVENFSEPENYESVRIWLCVYNTVLTCGAVWLVFRKTGKRAAEAAGGTEENDG